MRLIVVSNREPYVHRKLGDRIIVEKPAGGLTSALDNVLKFLNGTWIAWGSGTGDHETVDKNNRVAVPPLNPSYTLKRVWLTQSESDNYYTGYSNRVLWPLSHLTLDRVYYKKRFWDSYRRVNQKFADSVLQEVGPDTAVWTHDYHLCLMPFFLKQASPSTTAGYFWHIPWPDWSTFRILPQAKEILEGLLANDLIGFQIPLFVKNFINCAVESLAAEVDHEDWSIVFNGHKTLLRPYPISIDFNTFDSAASSKKVSAMKRLKMQLGINEEYMGIGVDRLEYTKALLKRLQAIDLFFEKYLSFRGRFTFVQIAVPTRLSEPYISYKKSVEELIHRINNKYASGTWKPIVYITTKIDHNELALYYRIADVAIISSVYDGMNLVAKEYIASQVDEKGVIILSEFAGASEELTGALIVNPYDIESFAESIKKALQMHAEEKRSRMAALRTHVRTNTIDKWTNDFIGELEACHRALKGTRNALFLFLDYDGTLSPLVNNPGDAVLDEGTERILKRLKSNYPVAIISGRELSDIMDRVKIPGIIYAGNHGAEIWDGQHRIDGTDGAKDAAVPGDLKKELSSRLEGIGGAVVEDKTATVSVHYRNVQQQDRESVFAVLWDTAARYCGRVRMTMGNNVFEVRPLEAWNKGDVVLWILQHFGAGKTPIYIGDDVTDEDAYRVINQTGISVSIGKNVHAMTYLKDQSLVKDFLEWLQ